MLQQFFVEKQFETFVCMQIQGRIKYPRINHFNTWTRKATGIPQAIVHYEYSVMFEFAFTFYDYIRHAQNVAVNY